MSKYVEECEKQFNLESFKLNDTDSVPRKKKCIFQCLAEKLDLMNEKGDLNVEAFKKKMQNVKDDENAKKYIVAIDKCTSETFSNPCDTAEFIYNCVMAE